MLGVEQTSKVSEESGDSGAGQTTPWPLDISASQ